MLTCHATQLPPALLYTLSIQRDHTCEKLLQKTNPQDRRLRMSDTAPIMAASIRKLSIWQSWLTIGKHERGGDGGSTGSEPGCVSGKIAVFASHSLRALPRGVNVPRV